MIVLNIIITLSSLELHAEQHGSQTPGHSLRLRCSMSNRRRSLVVLSVSSFFLSLLALLVLVVLIGVFVFLFWVLAKFCGMLC